MADDPTKDTGNTDPKGDEKTFTQADIDAAVAKASEPYKDFDKIKADADEYGLVKGSPRFETFVEQENKRYALGDEEYEKMYGTPAAGDDKGGDDDSDDWTPREKEMMKEINSIKETLAESTVASDKKAVGDELKAISSNKEKYPLFDKSIKMGDAEVPVRELMARELDKAEKAGRDMTMAQAYREATYEHQRDLGRKDAEDVMQKKRDAAKVGIPVSSPGRKSEGAKAFKTPEEAVEATLDELGI